MFSAASRVVRPLATQAARRHHPQQRVVSASFATVKEGLTATDAWNKSCYSGIDYTVNEDLPVYDAVQKFAAYNVGCLVTVDGEGECVGYRTKRIRRPSSKLRERCTSRPSRKRTFPTYIFVVFFLSNYSDKVKSPAS
jgi:hypothetical protein